MAQGIVAASQYRTIPPSIQSVLHQAVSHRRKPDFNRAAEHPNLGEHKQLDHGTVFDMLCASP
jgi:hypothetical protein